MRHLKLRNPDYLSEIEDRKRVFVWGRTERRRYSKTRQSKRFVQRAWRREVRMFFNAVV